MALLIVVILTSLWTKISSTAVQFGIHQDLLVETNSFCFLGGMLAICLVKELNPF